MNVEEAKKLMEEGWKARENLDFQTAEDLLNKAKSIFENEQDWFNVTECLNHLAYTDKLKAQQFQSKALDTAKEALAVAETKGTKEVLILRALISILDASGKYEEALKYARLALEKNEKPAARSDILCHIATFELRTGNLNQAEKSLMEAEDLMEKGWETEKDPFRSIWKVRILLTKGLILYNKNLKDEALLVGQNALDLAKQQDLKTRMKQAQDFLQLIDNK